MTEVDNNKLYSVFTAAEVDELWGKPQGTTKLQYHRKKFRPDEARKALRNILITVEGATRLFGDPKKDLVPCAICGSLEGDMTEVDGKMVCANCKSSVAQTEEQVCTLCGNPITGNVTVFSDKVICENCREKVVG